MFIIFFNPIIAISDLYYCFSLLLSTCSIITKIVPPIVSPPPLRNYSFINYFFIVTVLALLIRICISFWKPISFSHLTALIQMTAVKIVPQRKSKQSRAHKLLNRSGNDIIIIIIISFVRSYYILYIFIEINKN